MTYTENYNLKKPDANDYVSPAAFNDNADAIDAKLKAHDEHAAAKDNPHEVTAAQVGARADTWVPTAADVGTKRIYNNLSDISSDLTSGSTPFEVANAMEDGSMLVTATSGTQSNTGGLIPRAENGALIIIKYNIARVSYEFIGEATGFYDAYLRSTADRFTGWRRHYTTANLTVATTAPTSALANDAQVQVYDA